MRLLIRTMGREVASKEMTTSRGEHKETGFGTLHGKERRLPQLTKNENLLLFSAYWCHSKDSTTVRIATKVV